MKRFIALLALLATVAVAQVTTNPSVTGVLSSVFNSITASTGSGNTLVLQASPTLTTPTIGVATATSVNKVAITAPATSATLTIADGATLSYEEYTAGSAACVGAITTAAVWKLTKIGNVVTLYIPQTWGNGVAVDSFSFGTLLPAAYRPAATTYFFVRIRNNAATVNAPGMLTIGTDGTIAVWRNIDGTGAFTVTASAGIYESVISWRV